MKFINAALLALSLSFTLLPGTAIAGLNEGIAAYDKGDFSTALREFEPLAAQGDAIAQYALGTMYDEGKGVSIDYSEAIRAITMPRPDLEACMKKGKEQYQITRKR
jgi:TPR repeat protein